MLKWRKPRVGVYCQARGRWTVHVEGQTGIGDWVSIIVATYETRASANMYAKSVRIGLRGRFVD